jgi:hypothetical protein
VYDPQLAGLLVSLIAMCRNTEETRIFLRSKSGYKGSTSSFPYPRILVALELEQKEFIAHPHAQDVLNISAHRGLNLKENANTSILQLVIIIGFTTRMGRRNMVG